MNANPSGSRTPPTGCWGRSKARRELEAAAEPSSGHARVDGPAGKTGGTDRRVPGSVGGTRHAMKVCRGALNVMRAAQGRVGEISRHIAFLLVLHLLLSDEASGRTDAPGIDPAIFAKGPMRSGDPIVPRREVRTTVRPACRLGDLGLAPARNGALARFASCSEPFRGKGVRSA